LLPFGASRHQLPSRLFSCTESAALATPAPSRAAPNTAPTIESDRRPSNSNRISAFYPRRLSCNSLDRPELDAPGHTADVSGHAATDGRGRWRRRRWWRRRRRRRGSEWAPCAHRVGGQADAGGPGAYGPPWHWAKNGICAHLGSSGLVGMPSSAFAGTLAPVAAITINAAATAVLVIALQAREAIAQLILAPYLRTQTEPGRRLHR
jgi:hypothetical protein